METFFQLGALAIGMLVIAAVAVAAKLSSQGSLGGLLGGGLPGGGGAGAGVQALTDAFAGRLGYRSMPDATPDPAAAAQRGESVRTHQLRAYRGADIHYESETRYHGTRTSVSLRWWCDVPATELVPLHVYSAELGSALGGAKDVMQNKTRAFAPHYPTPLSIGDAAFDAKLRVCTAPGFEAHVSAVFADAGLRQRLLQLGHVDLHTTGGRVVFDDPFQELLLRHMGGTMGMLNLLTAQGIATQVWLHDAVADALVTVGLAAMRKG